MFETFLLSSVIDVQRAAGLWVCSTEGGAELHRAESVLFLRFTDLFSLFIDSLAYSYTVTLSLFLSHSLNWGGGNNFKLR